MPNYKRYYFSNHYVFITVVTYKRNNILIKNIDLLRECMIKTKEKFVFDIFAIVILPNHLHMIIKPEKIKDFSLITGSIKRRFTKSIDEKYKNADISESKLKRKEKVFGREDFMIT